MQHTKQERLCKEATIPAVNAKTATSGENTFSKCWDHWMLWAEEKSPPRPPSSSHHRQEWTPQGLQLSVRTEARASKEQETKERAINMGKSDFIETVKKNFW